MKQEIIATLHPDDTDGTLFVAPDVSVTGDIFMKTPNKYDKETVFFAPKTKTILVSSDKDGFAVITKILVPKIITKTCICLR